MKCSLALLALTLATFTSALPHPDSFAIERRGGEGDPYASHGESKNSNPYTNHKDGSGYEHGEKKRQAENGAAHLNNQSDPCNSDCGFDYPKRRSPANGDGGVAEIGDQWPKRESHDGWAGWGDE